MDFRAWIIAAVISATLLIDCVQSARDKNMYCGACLTLVDEMNYSILKTDPRKKLQVGSFRVDSRGNQGTYEVPLARSDLHLHELLESVCESMNGYAQSMHKESGRKSFVRTSSRDGKGVTLKDVTINGKISESLKFACETFIEEHEDDLVKLFKSPDSDVEKEVCIKAAGVCDQKDVEIYHELQKVTSEPPADESPKTDNTSEEETKEDEGADDGPMEDITDHLIKNAQEGTPDTSNILRQEEL